jgi:hypothetical protein
MLGRKHIQEAVQIEHQKRSARTYMDADKVLTKIAIILNSDIREYWEDIGSAMSLRDLQSLPRDVTECIESIKERISPTGDVTFEIKLYSKIAALKLAAQHLGLLMGERGYAQGPQGLAGPSEPVKLLGFPRDDYTIAEWEDMCREADEAYELAKAAKEEASVNEG